MKNQKCIKMETHEVNLFFKEIIGRNLEKSALVWLAFLCLVLLSFAPVLGGLLESGTDNKVAPTITWQFLGFMTVILKQIKEPILINWNNRIHETLLLTLLRWFLQFNFCWAITLLSSLV
jgi:hypothetical protein